jgi:outer membrane protein assembly factor BamB
MDDWTHARYAPDGNAVSQDTLVGPPTRLRWIAGPAWPRTHPGGPQAAVAAGGRLFYVFDEATPFMAGPSRVYLFARDACNGRLLWKQPVQTRFRKEGEWVRRRFNARTLLATEDRVYAALRPRGPLVALDAATGRVLKTYEKHGSPTHVLAHDGDLILADAGSVRRVDPATGQSRWECPAEPRNLLVGEGHLVTLERADGGYALSAIDPASGRRRWRVPTAPHAPLKRRSLSLVFCHAGLLLLADGYGGGHNYAFSAKDGRHLWTYAYRPAGSCANVFHVGGLVWVNAGGKNPEWRGLNPADGRVERRIPYLAGVSRGHHRCHLNKATTEYLLTGVKDFEVIGLRDGAFYNVRSVRGSCGAGGVLPANGLVYSFPHPCTCYHTLRGFLAIGTDAQAGDDPPPAGPRLQRGPAADQPIPQDGEPRPDEWPTYRHDFRRSACTPAAGPAALEPLWQHTVGGRLSAPTVAGGMVFVAAVDAHRLFALDARTGKPRWSYTAGARIDSPPTIWRGRVLFGAHDGWVYCLRAADGQRIWRLRAAPADRWIAADGQLESAWPVVGSVLVVKDTAYLAAGRHTHLDGGIHLLAVEPTTGKIRWHRKAVKEGPADVLISDGTNCYLYRWGYALTDGAEGYRWRAMRLGVSSRMGGVLERTWTLRGSANQSDDRTVHGQLVAFHRTAAYAVTAFPPGGGRDRVTTPGAGDYRLTAFTYKTPEGGGAVGEKRWSHPVHVRMRSMLLAAETLFVAGPPDAPDPKGARLLAFAAPDGRKLHDRPLPAPPVPEGMAAAHGRLYISMQDGTVGCFGTK